MQHELLIGLSSAEVEQVMALGTRITVPSGGALFKLGDPADRIFLVERGRIQLTLPMQVRGREEEILVEEKSPGQTVGWSALIPPHRFTLSARAPLTTEATALPRERLQQYLEGSPRTAYKISSNLALVIGRRLQLLQTMWLREMQRTIEQRSAAEAR
ncbi:MAG TPA: cyclic nucleotide-binding domain-containing protein [Candidatus Methylomirabilis sp.]|nr:cyclic nucleotide-binding domain-containing protein [Candidatus Methylomirabilis sp.]